MVFFEEPSNGLSPPLHMEFIKDIRQVVFYRFIAQAEMDGNFFICFSFGKQRQDEAFLRGQSGGTLGIRSKV